MNGDERADLLRWYVEMGVDEAIAADPQDRLASPPPLPVPRPVAAPPMPSPPSRTATEPVGGVASAKAAAAAATTLAALRAAVAAFDGCGLKRTATNTVFSDGVAGAPLLVVGEAPGADEDRQGLPFVGRSGQLLDRMLAAIGRDRKRDTYITNMLFWRPPGNRKPTDEEIATCLPFVWRLIALAAPRVVLLSGGTAAAALLDRRDGITRLRGRWFALAVPGLETPVPTLATYHPSFLLRSPARKGEAWHDMLEVQAKLESSE
ncbi:MAG TPA: uracil-DNA glycosylase [Stellaceae bacterium]|nr:uracil-DNA glycosylase [Stellaceae bacterium]